MNMLKGLALTLLIFSGTLVAQTVIQIGTGTGSPSVGTNPNNSANACSPYGTNVDTGANGKKWQAIYTKAMIETAMTNAGMSPGAASFSTVGFNITGKVGGGYTHQGYTIKMANVAQQDLSGGYYAGTFTTVYGPLAFTNNNNGWFSLNMSTPFDWDGTSNLCVEVCYTGNTPFLISTYGGCQYTDVGGNNHMGFSGGSGSSCATVLPGVGAQTSRLTNMRLTATVAASGHSISTGTIAPLIYCAGASVTVPYTASQAFNAGNIFTVQLSDASGSFSNPVNIGTVTATGSGSVQATIPALQTPGNAYRVRVIASSPAITGTDNGTNIKIEAVPGTPAIQHKD